MRRLAIVLFWTLTAWSTPGTNWMSGREPRAIFELQTAVECEELRQFLLQFDGEGNYVGPCFDENMLGLAGPLGVKGKGAH